MIFEQVATGGCQSYLVGCERTLCGALIDAEASQVERYIALALKHGLSIRYVLDTHTHADHFSAAKMLGEKLGVPVVGHRDSPSAYATLRLDDGDMLEVPGIVPKLSGTPGSIRRSGGAVGRDTQQVLTELAGLSAAEIERLCAKGVIFQAEQAAHLNPAPH